MITVAVFLQLCFVWIVASLLIYIFLLFTQEKRLRTRLNGKSNKYLLATAHPDDECMFFGPFVCTLLKWGAHLRLICLSSGNFYGLGEVRRQELSNSAKELGLSSEDGTVSLVDDSRLPDSMRESWAPEVVLEFVDENCEKHAKVCPRSELSIITFDSVGITRHPNHTAITQALASPQCEKCRLLSLVSIPFFVQYLGSLTCAPVIVLIWLWKKLLAQRSKGRNVYIVVASPDQWLRTIRAMRCHKSQIMWFRVLHLLLSSYLLVNIIEEDVCNDK